MNGKALALVALCALPRTVQATEWFVRAGAEGSGTRTAPFGRIQQAIDVARPGDTVWVARGEYAEPLRTVRDGTRDRPIVIRALEGRGSVLVTTPQTILTVSHAYHTTEGLVLDAQYAAADAVVVRNSGNRFVLRNSEVRRTAKDAIDIAAPEGVLIEDSLIHHALNATDGRTDAHGVAAGAVRNLTIRGTEIHTFSGDAIQVDPGRAAPGWNDVTIERCRLWLAALSQEENGFAAGTVPGENALDTKAAASLPRARILVRDTVAFGFRDGLIGNMSAFNLKEHIDATLDGITVYDSEIAFRIRGAGPNRAGALVNVRNAVVHSTATAFRYEERLATVRIWNTTIGAGVNRAFRPASATVEALDVRNLLVLAATLPDEAGHQSNLAVGADAFTNASAHDYRLRRGAAAIDAGMAIPEVATDRRGVRRPQDSRWDVGAYEFTPRPGRGGAGQGPPPAQASWTAGASRYAGAPSRNTFGAGCLIAFLVSTMRSACRTSCA